MLCVCASNTDSVPEHSLHALTTQVVDESLGLTCCTTVRDESAYSIANCGMALIKMGAHWDFESSGARDGVQLYLSLIHI
eukprot:6068238-Pyramimonas_sp.AAC.1